MAVPEIGVFLPSMSPRGELPGDMATTARLAEDLGLESVWVVDQLVGGTGVPFLDSAIALTAAAAATTRVRLGFGVVVLPLHPVVWLAKQIASLQHVSGNRVILGVGAGGDRHEQSWLAAGVPRRERGRRTDAALRLLPGLIGGRPMRLDDQPDSQPIQLAPAATVPSIVVGGMSEAAMVRTVDYADGWFLLPGPPTMVADAAARLADLAASRGRRTPALTATIMTAMTGDPTVPDHDSLVRRLTDVDGMFGIPSDQIPKMLLTGVPSEVAGQLAEYGHAGAERVVVTIAAGDWRRQVELLAEAHALLRLTTAGLGGVASGRVATETGRA